MELPSYPNIYLIYEYANKTGMESKALLDYEHKYWTLKKHERKMLSGFRLNEKEREEYFSIGRELEQLLEEILNKSYFF